MPIAVPSPFDEKGDRDESGEVGENICGKRAIGDDETKIPFPKRNISTQTCHQQWQHLDQKPEVQLTPSRKAHVPDTGPISKSECACYIHDDLVGFLDQCFQDSDDLSFQNEVDNTTYV